ncbi:hypothetical protein DL769_005866 [Monosporascus sp. CRB-8-3]|nr:hypothetical protein DL769_005866 [Monosporascus sp. CRB-8-3]
MLVPSLFAGLDIAADLGDTKVLPFDGGSWVQTITATGLPLIGLVAHYRGDGGSSDRSRPSDSDSHSFRRASVKAGATPPRPRGDSVLWAIRGRDVNGDGIARGPGPGRRRETETVGLEAGGMEDVELGASGNREAGESNENEDSRDGSRSGGEGTIRVQTDYVVTVEEGRASTDEYSRRQISEPEDESPFSDYKAVSSLQPTIDRLLHVLQQFSQGFGNRPRLLPLSIRLDDETMPAAGDNDSKLKELQAEAQRLGRSIDVQREKIKAHKEYTENLLMAADTYVELLKLRKSWAGEVGGLLNTVGANLDKFKGDIEKAKENIEKEEKKT